MMEWLAEVNPAHFITGYVFIAYIGYMVFRRSDPWHIEY